MTRFVRPGPALVSALFFFAVVACPLTAQAQDSGYVVTISAGDQDRRGVPVSFDVPDDVMGDEPSWVLADDSGDVLPVQISGGEATVIVDDLPAGTTREFELVRRESDTDGVAMAREEGGGIVFSVAGDPVLRYNSEPTELPRADIDPVYERGGYIHPVHTPSGRVITGDYPPDHTHHHGIWAAWTNTVFEGRTPDFWNMGDRTGTVEPVALDSAWNGPVHGGFTARHRYVDLSGETPVQALNEEWTVRVYDVEGADTEYRLFDLSVVHITASSSPLVLPEYRYGGVGFRGPDNWTGDENTFFLTSEGRDRSDGHATRARWVHISGEVDGALAGVAILADPENFRAPEPMRIHPDVPFFNWAPSQAGEWSIEPDQPFVARYRYVVADGGPDADQIDRLWADFADPPVVEVSTR